MLRQRGFSIIELLVVLVVLGVLATAAMPLMEMTLKFPWLGNHIGYGT